MKAHPLIYVALFIVGTFFFAWWTVDLLFAVAGTAIVIIGDALLWAMFRMRGDAS